MTALDPQISELLELVDTLDTQDFVEHADQAILNVTSLHGFTRQLHEAAEQGNYGVLFAAGKILKECHHNDDAFAVMQKCFGNGNLNAGAEICSMILDDGIADVGAIPKILKDMLQLEQPANAQTVTNAQSVHTKLLENYTREASRLEGKFSLAATGSEFQSLGDIVNNVGQILQPYIDAAAEAANDSIANG